MAEDGIVRQSIGLSLTHSDSLNELGTALAKAQAEIEGAKKDSTNPFFGKAYADLASVWAACRGPLTKNGLSVAQFPTATNGTVSLTTLLLHASGQWIASSCTSTPKDGGPQALGSVLTYLRRYSLAAVAGVPQIDDDAEGGEGRKTQAADVTTGQPKPSAGGATISEAQARRLFALSTEHGWTTEQVRRLLAACHVESTKAIKVADYDDICAEIIVGPKLA